MVLSALSSSTSLLCIRNGAKFACTVRQWPPRFSDILPQTLRLVTPKYLHWYNEPSLRIALIISIKGLEPTHFGFQLRSLPSFSLLL